jgi:transglutaminase-like putative cysteine protease
MSDVEHLQTTRTPEDHPHTSNPDCRLHTDKSQLEDIPSFRGGADRLRFRLSPHGTPPLLEPIPASLTLIPGSCNPADDTCHSSHGMKLGLKRGRPDIRATAVMNNRLRNAPMRRINISHVTEYLFPFPVTLLPHRLLLSPRANHHVRIECSVLEITPAHTLQWKRDVLDNSVALVSFTEPSDRLRVSSSVVIQHYEENPFDFLIDEYAVVHPFDYAEEDRAELAPFRQSVYAPDQDAVRRWLDGLGLRQSMQTFALLDRMNREIAGHFVYRMREEPGVQPPAVTLATNSGSCRDFAALFMEACRFLGLASRFVSGYLFAPATEVGNGSTHAWAEVYVPGAGWKGFDPTSGEVTGNRHIAVAVARHPEAVPPVAGSFLGPSARQPQLTVAVRVRELRA